MGPCRHSLVSTNPNWRLCQVIPHFCWCILCYPSSQSSWIICTWICLEIKVEFPALVWFLCLSLIVFVSWTWLRAARIRCLTSSASTKDRVWEPVSRKRHVDWERRNLLPCSPLFVKPRADIEGRKLFPRREEIWQSRRVKHHQLVWIQYALFLNKENCFCQSFLLLFITSECVYFDSFLFTLFFFPVVYQKYGPIWRQWITLCFPWPFQSGVTTAAGGALKKCQLAIKVSQTSIMSSSYESLGTAQNGAIMSIV